MESAYSLIYEKLEGWLTEAIRMLPNLLVAVLVVLAFGLLARMIRNLIHGWFRRTIINETLIRVVTSGTYFVILLVGVLIALNVLRLYSTVTSLLAGAGIVGLALSFAFQDIATNLMAGVILSLKKPVKTGDVIEIQDYEGTVTSIGLRTTRMMTFQGQHLIVPNKEFIQSIVINYSQEGSGSKRSIFSGRSSATALSIAR